MKTVQEWLAEYGESHCNSLNQTIHKVCVPLILWSVLGFFTFFPASGEGLGLLLGLAPLLCAFLLGYYALLGFRSFLLMFIVFALCLSSLGALRYFFPQSGLFFCAIFIFAWIGQGIGHWFEGRKPSFLKDLQFLLIGPLWVFRFLL